MKEQPKYVLLDNRKSLGESLVSDGWTFGLLLLCIWASQGSKWWTFLTALMFLAFLLVEAETFVNTRQHKFKDLGELEAWVAQERSNAQGKPPTESGSA